MNDTRRKTGGGRRPARRGNSGRRGGAGSRGGPAPKALEPTDTPPDIESFAEFELDDDTQAAIAAMGITKPTPIQALSITPVLQRRDVIAKAETGTGKTLAFGAPMMSRIDPSRASVLALILSPTRELAEQVYNVLQKLGDARGVKVALIVGGEPLQPQVRALQGGAQVVVATPGRVIDLMGQGFLNFPWTEFVVLDEADKMLEIGFIDDVRKILEATDPDIRQTLLFSATFPPALLQLAREHTRDPLEVATAAGVATVDTIRQTFLRCTDESRSRALVRVIEDSKPDDVFLVFCDRRSDVDQLFRRMERMRFSVKALHGGYDQAARFRVMDAFRTGEVKALIATDVASRGLDVEHVTHVVNYGVPRDVSDYTHRIGRTGRAGRTGTAMTLVAPRDEGRWKLLTRGTPWDIEELDHPGQLRLGKEEGRSRDERGSRRDRGEGAEGRRPRGRDGAERDDERPRRRGRGRDEERGDRRRERDAERPSRAPQENASAGDASESRPGRGRRERGQDAERSGAERNGSRERGRRRSRSDEGANGDSVSTEVAAAASDRAEVSGFGAFDEPAEGAPRSRGRRDRDGSKPERGSRRRRPPAEDEPDEREDHAREDHARKEDAREDDAREDRPRRSRSRAESDRDEVERVSEGRESGRGRRGGRRTRRDRDEAEGREPSRRRDREADSEREPRSRDENEPRDEAPTRSRRRDRDRSDASGPGRSRDRGEDREAEGREGTDGERGGRSSGSDREARAKRTERSSERSKRERPASARSESANEERPRESGRTGGGGFGAGVDSHDEPSKPRRARPEKKPRKGVEAREPTAEKSAGDAAPPSGGGGFGAGL